VVVEQERPRHSSAHEEADALSRRGRSLG